MYTVHMEKTLGNNMFTLLIININYRILYIINGKRVVLFLFKTQNKPYLHDNNISSSFFYFRSMKDQGGTKKVHCIYHLHINSQNGGGKFERPIVQDDLVLTKSIPLFLKY